MHLLHVLCRDIIRDPAESVASTTRRVKTLSLPTPMEAAKVFPRPSSPRISTKDATQAIAFRHDIRHNYLNLPCPVLLFTLFILSVLTHNATSQSFQVEAALRSRFAAKGSDVINANTTLKFLNIARHTQVIPWLQYSLAPEIFTTTDYNETGRAASFNRVLRAIKVRTMHARRRACNSDQHFGQVYNQCYDPVDLSEAVDYVRVDSSLKEAQDLLHSMKFGNDTRMNTAVNESTRSLDITIPIYNGELKLFGVVQLNLVFGLGGAIAANYELATIPSTPYQAKHSTTIDVFFFLVFGYMLFLEAKHVKEYTIQHGTWQYFRNFWAVVHLFSPVAIVVTHGLLFRVYVCVQDPEFREQLHNSLVARRSEVSPVVPVCDQLAEIASLMQRFRLFAMISCLVLSIRVLKSFKFQPRLAVLTNTIDRSLNEVGPFAVVFFIVFLAYAVSATMLFGSRLSEFSSIWDSLVTCSNILFGSFEFGAIKEVNHTAAVLWYSSYRLIVTMILFNMFMAIVFDAYKDVKSHHSVARRPIRQELQAVLQEAITERRQRLTCDGRQRISMHKLKREISRGRLKDVDQISVASLMALFDVTEDIAESTISSLKSYRPPDPVANDDDSDLKLDFLQSIEDRLQRLEDKLDQVASINGRIDAI